MREAKAVAQSFAGSRPDDPDPRVRVAHIAFKEGDDEEAMRWAAAAHPLLIAGRDPSQCLRLGADLAKIAGQDERAMQLLAMVVQFGAPGGDQVYLAHVLMSGLYEGVDEERRAWHIEQAEKTPFWEEGQARTILVALRRSRSGTPGCWRARWPDGTSPVPRALSRRRLRRLVNEPRYVRDRGAFIGQLEESTRRRPEDVLGWFALCEGLVAAGRIDEAVSSARRGNAVHPDALTNSLVKALEAEGTPDSHDRARREAAEWAKRRPDDPEPMVVLALMAFRDRREGEALSWTDRACPALLADPRQVRASLDLGARLASLVDQDERTIALLSRVVQFGPPRGSQVCLAHIFLATLLEARANDRSRWHLEQAMRSPFWDETEAETSPRACVRFDQVNSKR